MKIRIKFSKTGPLKYIGHLDVMRYFQKLNNRAHIPVAYSEGFSPHQILSFTPPLSLGAESIGEYADIEITTSIKSVDAVKALNENSVEGIQIESFKLLPDNAPNAMSCVTAAKYRCSLKENLCFDFDINKELEELFKSDKIEVLKKSKKNERIVDIKPLIYDFEINESYSDFLVSAGSVDNLKPELIYKVIFDKHGLEMPERPLNLIRQDMYTGDKDNLISLNDIGTEIL